MTIFDVYSGSHGSAGSPLRFAEAKAAGVEAIIVKTTQGTGYVNPFAEGDLADAQTAGLATASYHYAGNPDGTFGAPAAEAQFAKDNAHGRFVWLDLEQLVKASLNTSGEWASEFFGAIGEAAGLYCDRSYLDTLPGAPYGRPLWIADPGDVDTPAEAVMVQTGTATVGWAPVELDVDKWVGTADERARCFTAASAGPIPASPAPGPAAPPAGPAPEPVTDETVKLPALKFGDSGGAVMTVQALLKAKGKPQVTIDGEYTRSLAAAVADWQAFFKLQVTGTLDVATWGALVWLPLAEPATDA